MLPFGEYKNQHFSNLTFNGEDLKRAASAAKENNLSNSYKLENITFVKCNFENVDFARYFQMMEENSSLSFIGCSFKECWYSNATNLDFENTNATISLTACSLYQCSTIAATIAWLNFEACDMDECSITDMNVASNLRIDGCRIGNCLFHGVYVGGYGMTIEGNYISETVMNDVVHEAGKFETKMNIFYASTIRIPRLEKVDSYESNIFEETIIL